MAAAKRYDDDLVIVDSIFIVTFSCIRVGNLVMSVHGKINPLPLVLMDSEWVAGTPIANPYANVHRPYLNTFQVNSAPSSEPRHASSGALSTMVNGYERLRVSNCFLSFLNTNFVFQAPC